MEDTTIALLENIKEKFELIIEASNGGFVAQLADDGIELVAAYRKSREKVKD